MSPKGVNAFVFLGYIATGDIEPEEKLILSWIEGPVLKKPNKKSLYK